MALYLAPNRRQSSNPAQCTVSGSISNTADWVETLVIVDGNGDQVTGVGSDNFTIELRDDPIDSAADLTLDAELTITVGATTTLAISVAQDDLSGLDTGDYVIDIYSETSGGVITHRGHGRITVFGIPV